MMSSATARRAAGAGRGATLYSTTARCAAGAGRGATLCSALGSLPGGRDNNDSVGNENNSMGIDDDDAATLAQLETYVGLDVDMGNGDEIGDGAVGGGPAATVASCDPDGAGLSSFCAFWDDDDSMGSAAYDDSTIALLEACMGLDVDMGNGDDVATDSSAVTSPDAAWSPASAFVASDDDEMADESMDGIPQGEQGTALHARYYRNTAHNVRCFPSCIVFDSGIDSYRLHTRSNGQCSAPYTVVLPPMLAFGSLRAVAAFCLHDGSPDDAKAPPKGWPTTTNVTCDAYSTVITFPASIWKLQANLTKHKTFYLHVRLFDDETLIAQHNSALFEVCNIPKRRRGQLTANGEKSRKRARLTHMATTSA